MPQEQTNLSWLGSKREASIKLESHLVTFATLLGCRRANWSAKIYIPNFYQIHQKCKRFSQGKTAGRFGDELEFNPKQNFPSQSLTVHIQNTGQNEKKDFP